MSKNFQGVKRVGVARQMFAPRTALNRLGRLEAQGRLAGEDVPQLVARPVRGALPYLGRGAALGGVLGALVGAGLGGITGGSDIGRFALRGGILGGGVGTAGGVVTATIARSRRARELADRLEAAGEVPTDPARAEAIFTADPKQAKSRLLISLLGLGPHQRGRLDTYAEALGGTSAQPVSVVPDVLRWVPYVSAISELGTAGMDTVKAHRSMKRLRNLRTTKGNANDTTAK